MEDPGHEIIADTAHPGVREYIISRAGTFAQMPEREREAL